MLKAGERKDKNSFRFHPIDLRDGHLQILCPLFFFHSLQCTLGSLQFPPVSQYMYVIVLPRFYLLFLDTFVL